MLNRNKYLDRSCKNDDNKQKTFEDIIYNARLYENPARPRTISRFQNKRLTTVIKCLFYQVVEKIVALKEVNC